MAKLLASEAVGKSDAVVSENKVVLEGCFAGLDRNTAMFGLGVGLLRVQITSLEDRCATMRGRLDRKSLLVETETKKKLP